MELSLVLGMLAALAGLGVVVMQTWRNGAPTESIAQVLHDVEHPPAAPGTHRGRS